MKTQLHEFEEDIWAVCIAQWWSTCITYIRSEVQRKKKNKTQNIALPVSIATQIERYPGSLEARNTTKSYNCAPGKVYPMQQLCPSG